MKLRPVSDSFFEIPTLELAPRLLGTLLVHETPEGTASGRIVEVEAYMGSQDPAAHSYSGTPTKRTKAMFGPPGRLYVYVIYGMHNCCNVVSGPEGRGEAVLIRALEPVSGKQLMAKRRDLSADRPQKELTNGPGKLSEALAVTRKQYGADLTRPPVYLAQDKPAPSQGTIARGPRIGIENSGEARHFPWRFWLTGNSFVSRSG